MGRWVDGSMGQWVDGEKGRRGEGKRGEGQKEQSVAMRCMQIFFSCDYLELTGPLTNPDHFPNEPSMQTKFFMKSVTYVANLDICWVMRAICRCRLQHELLLGSDTEINCGLGLL